MALESPIVIVAVDCDTQRTYQPRAAMTDVPSVHRDAAIVHETFRSCRSDFVIIHG